MIVTEPALAAMLARVLLQHGMTQPGAGLIAGRMAAAEHDGAVSHGLLRLPGYLSDLACGWTDGAAVPEVTQPAPAIIAVDARNGYAQLALEAARPAALAAVRSQGLAAICIRDSHHLAALWADIEPFARQGLVALTMVNARSRMVAWGATRRVFGTNPIAFACPNAEGPPLIWDFATTQRSQGDLLLARAAGQLLPDGVGVDAAGRPTNDPGAILDGGGLLPFGGYKGAGIALMVEVLAAAFTGGRFGFEDESAKVGGAMTSRAGQFVLLADPRRSAGERFFARIDALFAVLRESGAERLPSDRRYALRLRDEFAISDEAYALIVQELK